MDLVKDDSEEPKALNPDSPIVKDIRDVIFRYVDASTIVIGYEPAQNLERLAISHPRIVSISSAILDVAGSNQEKHWTTVDLCESMLSCRPLPVEDGNGTPVPLADAFGIREIALIFTAAREWDKEYWIYRKIKKNKSYLEQIARQANLPAHEYWTLPNTKRFLRDKCPGFYYQMKMMIMTNQLKKWTKLGRDSLSPQAASFWKSVFLDEGELPYSMEGVKKEFDKRNDLWDVDHSTLLGYVKPRKVGTETKKLWREQVRDSWVEREERKLINGRKNKSPWLKRGRVRNG